LCFGLLAPAALPALAALTARAATSALLVALLVVVALELLVALVLALRLAAAGLVLVLLRLLQVRIRPALAVALGERNLELVQLVPLGVGAIALRDGEQLLQPLPRARRLRLCRVFGFYDVLPFNPVSGSLRRFPARLDPLDQP
jgi:hypothetical protein